MRRFSAGCALALAAAALGSSCKTSPPSTVADAAPPATGLSVEEAMQVLARIGDRTITVGDFVAALEHMDQFDRMRYQAPERRQELLAEMIDVILLADEARDKGYDRDPIAQQEIREVLRDAMLKRAREGTPAPGAISDDETRAYYEQHKADFRDPERRRISVIVVPTRGSAATVLEATGKASPAQWGELVRARSTDPQARSAVPADLAGDFGFVSPPGDPRGANPRVPDEVRAAAFEVPRVGEVLSRAVQSGPNFYVVKLTGRTEPHERTFEDAKRAIQVKLAQDKIRAKEEALLDELRQEYPVLVDESALSDVAVDLPRSDGGT